MYWDKVLQEVLSKDTSTLMHKFRVTNLEVREPNKKMKVIKKSNVPRIKHNYVLGPKYNGAYFTPREAECMLLILKGKTINKAAEVMQLSPRTIEFYLKNMKSKIGCRTKFELVEMVLESSFLQNVYKVNVA